MIMIRKLCFAVIAMLFAASACSASFVIDDFSAAGAFGATTTGGLSYVNVPGFQGYEALNVAPGGTVSLTYSFAGSTGAAPAVAGTLAAAAFDSFISSGGSNPDRPFPALTALVFPFAGSPASAFPIGFSIEDESSVVLASGPLTGSPQQVQVGTALGSVEQLTFSFTNDSADTLNFQIGGGALTAVPEPTSLLMFTSAMGLVLVPRRRRR